ncbi:zinc-binding dehydrogenase [Marinobacter adhaerens]|jgi:NADPH:quinone reductase-like Zn-dependent oxidoreductase|uniref:Zinc-binding dehydrogenase n=3 Tax=Marinobacter adhaerens TaxID=1033846 RepID=A0ABX8INJ6_9GAMM|nr:MULTISPECIES: zinc-binding dehydrogenase [Marinobacter]MAM51309.1 alcohol dehydrogenase [Marinobacter sp.]MCP4062794.1 zinc-binding dehydrogenase [Gammaproteobacteria bacterium]MBW3227799.1 zinc-binding dehydrogenase [Marinobacter adhaerens]MBW4979327.1 zinc-binding dehydrogenase [Marinobacter adhaerens]QWV14655.1 zinc-binding dehydrogenase [Marinobacter adhaerens]|tara:strand:+ start:329 stop:1471 length:1143 start_codon:yes stop_codon:yes gene_type:complete
MIPNTMKAMVLTGHGDVDKLEYQDVPVPAPGAGQVLVQVTATAKNNTDRKAREGLYPTKKGEMTSFQMGGKPTLVFPRIQGADIAGRVVAVGDGVDESRIGERGLLDFNIYANDRRDINLTPDYYGHGADGGYAEYVALPADQFHHIPNAELADAEVASMGMCSYQTAMHMLTSANIKAGERVLVTGASGGVGTALIQLCRIMGAIPYALSKQDKAAALLELGAEAVLDRSDMDSFVDRVKAETGGKPIDAVMDLVGGEMTDVFIDTMIFDMNARSTYPRLSIAGASGGNISEILWTRIYLYQVQIFGVSHGTREEAEQLMAWIRGGQLKPVLHGAFRLSDLHRAEEYFVNRGSNYLGKIVIVPDSQWEEHGQPWSLESA